MIALEKKIKKIESWEVRVHFGLCILLAISGFVFNTDSKRADEALIEEKIEHLNTLAVLYDSASSSRGKASFAEKIIDLLNENFKPNTQEYMSFDSYNEFDQNTANNIELKRKELTYELKSIRESISKFQSLQITTYKILVLCFFLFQALKLALKGKKSFLEGYHGIEKSPEEAEKP